MMTSASATQPARILDSHIHLTDCDRVRYRWEDIAGIPRALSPADYAAATQGFPVEGFIFVEAGAREDQSATEAQWVAELAAAGAPVAAIVAQADLRRGAPVTEDIDRLTDIPLVRGLRWILEPPFETDDECCVRPAFVEATRLLARYGYTLDISVKAPVLPCVIQLVRACPQVRFVLDHIGKPDIARQTGEPWRTHIRHLAECENAMCKISGVPMEAGRDWTVETVRRFVLEVADAFGPDRILFGSDWPAQHPNGTFASWTKAAVEIMAGLSGDERDRFFYRNAAAAYGIEK
jgi:L-fuconolactonase